VAKPSKNRRKKQKQRHARRSTDARSPAGTTAVPVAREIPLAQAIPMARAFLDQGDLRQAETLTNRILAASPSEPHALHLLGLIALRAGVLADAEDLIRRALQAQPQNAEFLCNLGLVCQTAGRLNDAAAYYEQALAFDPESVYALNNLANTEKARGAPQAARALLDRALALRPDQPQLWYNLGRLQEMLSDADGAAESYGHAIRCNPAYGKAHISLGGLLRQAGRLQEAETHFRRAIQMDPQVAEGYMNLGNLLAQRGETAEAVAMLTTAIRLDPASAQAHNSLANVRKDQGEDAEAIRLYEKAIALDPTFVAAMGNLGKALNDTGRFAEAAPLFETALRLQPDNGDLASSLAYAKLQTCDWEGLSALEERVAHSVERGRSPVTPFALIALSDSAELQLRCSRTWTRTVLDLSGICGLAPPFRHAREPRRKLTIGYLSNDFRDHVVGRLLVNVLGHHDHDCFRVIGYAFGSDDGSGLRQRIAAGLDAFVDIQPLSHRDAARRIHQDRVDILVDLKGATEDSRLEIPALRPAPIQARWLGHAGTMGADFYDYLLADAFAVPACMQPFYTEKLVHLPHSYQIACRDPLPDRRTRADFNLPEDAFVFCCFNTNYKITPDVFAIWMELLHAIPRSVLWLYAGNPLAQQNLTREATTRGIAPERLIFAPPLPQSEHLARYPLADLFLDTRRVSACATTGDALWMGCPVLTCTGETFASRAAGSLLLAAGLPELVTDNLDVYRARAMELATDPASLRTLRERLQKAKQTAPLFDVPGFVRHLEAAYQTMWSAWCEGQVPHPFAVSAEASESPGRKHKMTG